MFTTRKIETGKYEVIVEGEVVGTIERFTAKREIPIKGTNLRRAGFKTHTAWMVRFERSAFTAYPSFGLTVGYRGEYRTRKALEAFITDITFG